MASQSKYEPGNWEEFYEGMRNELFNAPTVSESICINCEKEPAPGQTLQRCGSCKAAFYCTRDCQKQHWQAHKAACKRDSRKTVPINTESIPGVVQFGPVMMVGEINLAGKRGGPKKQYEDRGYNPTPKEIHEHCTELLRKMDAEQKAAEKAKAERRKMGKVKQAE